MKDIDTVWIYGKLNSQTDLAANIIKDFLGKKREYYGEEDANNLISNIPEHSIMLLPAWNLYYGLVDKADYLAVLAKEECILNSLDSKRIEFAVCEKAPILGDRVISVDVARAQCSKFFKEKDIAKRFEGLSDTNEAEDRFLNDTAFSTFLCAPELADGTIKKASTKGLNVIRTEVNASNSSNYTVFGSFMNSSEPIVEEGDIHYWLLEMENLPNELEGESRDRFWNDVIGIESDGNFSLCVFLAELDPSYGGIRLLLETKHEFESPLPHDASSSDDGYKVRHVGKSSSLLSDRLHNMLDGKGMLGGDGQNSPGLLACPDSGIFIHGYSQKTIASFASDLAKMFRQKMGLLGEGAQKNIQPYLDLIDSL